MSRRERFTCTVTRDEDGRVLSIEILSVSLDDRELRAWINASRAPLVAGPLHQILRAGGVTPRQWSASKPIELQQTVGAQAQLLLRAVKPLRRISRIQEVAEGISQMSREEASYWHAKALRARGLSALRTLLSAERL